MLHPAANSYTPVNDENTLFISANDVAVDFDEIRDQINAHFGRFHKKAELADFTFEAQHIHTECLGYDRYDPGDWTNYLVIRRK